MTTVSLTISDEQATKLHHIAEQYGFVHADEAHQNGNVLSDLVIAIAEGDVQLVAAPPLKKPNNLERFAGSWSDMTPEELDVFQEILAEGRSNFDRPLADIFIEE